MSGHPNTSVSGGRMSARSRTHTVQSAYRARDGKTRVYVKDHPLPLFCDEPVSEGDAVVIVGDRAERPK